MAHLFEWHIRQELSFNPVFVTLWVGLTNLIWPEAGGAMLASLAMHCCAIVVLIRAGSDLRISTLVVLLVWSIWPVMLLYDGIVWKDVMFANAAVLASSVVFVSSGWPHSRPTWAAMLALSPFLVLARQNGAAFALCLAVAFAYMPSQSWSKWLSRTLITFAAMLAVSGVVNLIAASTLSRPGASDLKGASVGLLLLRVFDTAGTLVQEPDAVLALPEFDAATNAAIARELRASYSPTRLDTLDFLTVRNGIGVDRALARNHARLVLQHPSAWLRHRLTLFVHVLGVKDQKLCMPTFTGVAELSEERAKLMPMSQPRSPWVQPMSQFYFDNLWGTPVMSGASYLALVVLGGFAALAAHRRASHRQNVVVACVALGVVAFCLSFLLVGISCDFRYTYLAVPMAFWVLLARLFRDREPRGPNAY
jgi:hypothetical protein